jgi:hypothetical protein
MIDLVWCYSVTLLSTIFQLYRLLDEKNEEKNRALKNIQI